MAEDQDARLRAVEVAVATVAKTVADHEGDIHRFGPLVTEQALLRQMAAREFESLGKGLDKAHEAVRHLDERLDDERAERIEGQRKRVEELEAAVSERRQEMAASEERRQQAEQEAKAREKAAEEARLLQHNELKSRLRVAVIVLAGTMLSSGVTVLVAIIVARGGK